MKKTIFVTFTLLSFIGAGLGFIYDKFMDLNNQLSNLKSLNKKLTSDNKKLTKKQKSIKSTMAQRKKQLFTKKLSRAKYKLAKAPASAIPFVGAVGVAGMTYYDITNACDDIKEFKKFENSILGESDNSISEEEKALCGYDQQAIENIVLKDFRQFQQDTNDLTTETYDFWRNYFNGKYN